MYLLLFLLLFLSITVDTTGGTTATAARLLNDRVKSTIYLAHVHVKHWPVWLSRAVSCFQDGINIVLGDGKTVIVEEEGIVGADNFI